ncbi:MAG: glycosyl transferase family 2 [Bacteroidota bacterium]|nr:glycosyl transferase family 2 [Bacteroidota bacterium]
MIKETHLAEALDKNGFCILPVLSFEKILCLKNLFQKYTTQIDIHEDISIAWPEINKVISAEIWTIVEQDIAEKFSNYRHYASHFFVRRGGEKYQQALHQNWNITDEKNAGSYQVQIPLSTLYPQAGGKFLVPGSHRFFQNYRSGSCGIPVVAEDETSKEIVTEITLLEGSGLVYHNSVFHGAFSNETEQDSVSVIIYLIDDGADSCYFHRSQHKDVFEQYPITGDALFDNLECLKQGKIPVEFLLEKQVAMPRPDNSIINSTLLKSAFNQYWGEASIAGEIKMLHIARDKSLEEKLNRDGYAVLNFAGKDTIAKLRNYFYEQFGQQNFEPGMLITINDMTWQRKREIHNFFCTTLKNEMDVFFRDYVTPVSSFFTKNPSTLNSYLPIHTDSNLVLNPHLEAHYALWIPLQDVDENNGAVTVVKNSHRLPPYIAAATIPWPFDKHQQLLKDKMQVLNLKAGEAIVFDNRLIHCSTPNKTGQIRIGLSIRLTHFLTPYYSFYRPDTNKNILNVYHEEHDFYLAENWRNSDKEPVTGRKTGEILLSPYLITEKEILKVIEA